MVEASLIVPSSDCVISMGTAYAADASGPDTCWVRTASI